MKSLSFPPTRGSSQTVHRKIIVLYFVKFVDVYGLSSSHFLKGID